MNHCNQKHKIRHRAELLPAGGLLKIFGLPAFSKMTPVSGTFNLGFGFVTSEAK